jgi:hypothetical protein
LEPAAVIACISAISSTVKQLGDHQCGFRLNRSTNDQIFCIRQILGKKWEYNETVHQLFIAYKKAYDSMRREVLHNIIEFGLPMKLVRKARGKEATSTHEVSKESQRERDH